MAMQSGKEEPSGSGPNPALSDEAADQFASSFTPAWDNEEVAAADVGARELDALPPAPDAPPIVAMPVIFAGSKRTMIGVAAPADTPAPEDIEPENVLEIVTVPPAQAAPVQAAPPVHVNHGARTQVMDSRPPPPPHPPHPATASESNARPPSAAPRSAARNAGAAVAADPFGKASPSEDLDYVPKKSSKTFIFVIAGLAVLAGLGLFLKFALTDDAPKAPAQQLVTGPAVATAEIPPPPPKVEAPPPATPATATAPSGGAGKAEPAPAPLAPPPRQAAGPDRAAPRSEPRPPRQSAPAAQAAVVAPPPAAAPQRTPPKPPSGGIVRDNPF